MSSFGKKIQQFENSQDQSIRGFNELFIDAPLKGFSLKCEVEIGDILGPDTRRVVYVDGVPVTHDFRREEGGFDEVTTENTGPKGYVRKLDGLRTNKNTENFLITDKEVNLGPIKYFILQYLRGSENPYHNVNELIARLKLSKQTINKHLKELSNLGVISVTPEVKSRTKIVVTEEGAV